MFTNPLKAKLYFVYFLKTFLLLCFGVTILQICSVLMNMSSAKNEGLPPIAKNTYIHLPSLSDNDFLDDDGGKNIFFLETSMVPKTFSASQMCAIESAAFHYPDYRIFVISIFHTQVTHECLHLW